MGSKRVQAMAKKTLGRHVSLRRPGGRGVWIPRQRAFNFLRPSFVHIANDPVGYPWSSYHHSAVGQPAPLITLQEQHTLLATTPTARQVAHRVRVHEHVEEKHLDDLRQHTQQQRACGTERFQQRIEALNQRSASIRPRGRPPSPRKNKN